MDDAEQVMTFPPLPEGAVVTGSIALVFYIDADGTESFRWRTAGTEPHTSKIATLEVLKAHLVNEVLQ